PPTGIVRAFVRRETGEGVVGLGVQLRGQAALARSGPTDTGGRVVFSDLPEGLVTLETFEGATNTAASATATVVADQTVDAELRLTVGGTVTGRVTNASGQPVAGVQVT